MLELHDKNVNVAIIKCFSEHYKYNQYTSSNYNEHTSSRESNYDNFKINNSKYTYNVSTFR